jgi:hypothetical protein
MRVHGTCHCGAVRLEADVDPNAVAICHCTDCQILSGSPYRTAALVRQETLCVRGATKTYVKIAESGRRRAQVFCPECGTPLYAADADTPSGVASLRTGCLAERAALTPTMQIWCGSAADWTDDLPAIPAHGRQEPLEAMRSKG